MDINKIKSVSEELLKSNLIFSHGACISFMQEGKVYITKRDTNFSNISEADFVEVGLDEENGASESDYWPIHQLIYKSKNCKAIIQATPKNAIALSITENRIVPQDASGLSLFRGAPIAKVRQPNSIPDIVRMLPNVLNDTSNVIMVKGMASFAIGISLEETLKLTTCLEYSSEIIYKFKMISQGRSQSSSPRPGRDNRHSHHGSRDMRRGAIPPSIGVMDRQRNYRRGNMK